jgi:hypothetical protein
VHRRQHHNAGANASVVADVDAADALQVGLWAWKKVVTDRTASASLGRKAS